MTDLIQEVKASLEIRKELERRDLDTIWLKQLIDRLETAERQREEAVKALEWYGAEKTYRLGVNITMGAAFPLHEPIKEDKGELARTTLKRIKGENGHEKEKY